MPVANFIFDIGGSECVTTLDVALISISEAAGADALAVFMLDAWVPLMATQCTFREVRLGEAVEVVGEPGTGETNALPANCALIVQKNTGTAVRGRFFLPGLAEADCDAGGRVGSELRGLVDTAFAAAHTALIGDGVQPRVASTRAGGSLAAITSYQARPLVATLRNRVVTR